MGTKISALTETGSAPTGAYYPLEYDNANYKISTETLRGNLGGKYTADWAQSHGGVTVANGATLTITHNLGTTDVTVFYYVNSSASDTNAQEMDFSTYPSYSLGAAITSTSDNSVTLQLGSGGYLAVTSSGDGGITNFTNKYLKVVVLSAGTGLGGRYVADWAQSHGGVTVANGATLTITHNLGTTDICVSAFANASASDVGADGLDGIISTNPNHLTYGVFITSIIDENSFVLQLADTGYGACNSFGSVIGLPFTDKFLKVVVLAAGSSGGDSPRAYVAFDGTAANMVTELAGANSHNVASITDNGAGDYTINFSTPVSKPIISISYEVRASSPYHAEYWGIIDQADSYARIGIGSNNVYYDHPYVSFIAH